MKKLCVLLVCLSTLTNINAQTGTDLNESGTNINAEVVLSNLPNNPIFESAKRARTFKLNSAIRNHQNLEVGDQINLQLFNDKNYKTFIKNKTTDVNGVTALVVRLKEFEFAYGYIIISKESYLITIEIPELKESYKTKYSKQSNTVFLLQLDESKIEVPYCGTTSDISTDNLNRIKSTKAELDPSPTCLTLPGASDLATIRILVLYTIKAENWVINNLIAPDNTINIAIATAIANANNIASNNNLGINFVLVNSEESPLQESSAGADLTALRNNATVQALRTTNDADLVALLTQYDDTSQPAGIANLLKTRYGNPNIAFSNTQVNYALNGNTFIHELAHNFGADHYRGQSSSEGPNVWIDWTENTWTSGWRFQGNDTNMYGTVMTYTSPSLYADGLPTYTIPYFSDPSITYLGTKAGDEALADNATTLKEIKHYIARYRNAAPYCTASVSAPTAFYITNVNMCEIDHNSIESVYSDLSSLATCMQPSELQRLTVQIHNSSASIRLKVWIDWDNDKAFNETDELAYASTTGSGLYSIDITAPSDVTLGEKRMRIRIYNTGTPGVNNSTPCGSSTFGEIEDYTINVVSSHLCDPLSLNDISTNTLKYFYNSELDILTLKSPNSPLSSITLYNLLGQQVLNKGLSQSTEKIDISWLSDGLFIGKVSVNDRIQTIKILKH